VPGDGDAAAAVEYGECGGGRESVGTASGAVQAGGGEVDMARGFRWRRQAGTDVRAAGRRRGGGTEEISSNCELIQYCFDLMLPAYDSPVTRRQY
jgi:hypothetical protein